MKFWNKLKYWQKGGIIGFLLSLSFVIYLWVALVYFQHEPPNFFKFSLGFLILPPSFIVMILTKLFGGQIEVFTIELMVITALITPMFYFLVGALIGLIIGKYKNQKKVRSK